MAPTLGYWIVEGRLKGAKGGTNNLFTGGVEVPSQGRPLDFYKVLLEGFEKGTVLSSIPSVDDLATNARSARNIVFEDEVKWAETDDVVKHKLENHLAWTSDELKEWKARSG